MASACREYYVVIVGDVLFHLALEAFGECTP